MPKRKVLMTAARKKLLETGRMVQWSDYSHDGGHLGEGTYGKVLRVRKNDGGAEYAVKIFTGTLGDPLTFEVLLELKALFKVKKGWQAFDMLDEAWCPIVQVHGLFTDIVEPSGGAPQCGLLMELYGISLYDVLQESQHKRVCAQLNLKNGLPTFNNAARITVAQNVASACRYLHDLGMLHRDLKDQNVLVDPSNGYRAKLTDFGTSKNTRQVFQRESVGTTHTLAPEALLAMDEYDTSVNQAELELDSRAIDVYAYGILLCALWDGSKDQRRHIPLKAGEGATSTDKAVAERDISLACKNHVRDKVTYPPDGLRPEIPEHSKEGETHDMHMPHEFVELMKDCWRFDPDKRPSFSTICKRLKEHKRKQASLLAKRTASLVKPAQLRVVLNVTYNAKVKWEQSECVFELNATVESPDAPLPTLPHGVTDGIASYSFPFMVYAGESVAIDFVHVFGDHQSKWFSRSKNLKDGERIMTTVLLSNIQCGAVSQPVPTRQIVVKPDWDDADAKLIAAGAPVALMVQVERTQQPPSEPEPVTEKRLLGVLQVELLPKDGVPRMSSARRLNRMSTGLRESRNWRDCQVFLSYRDSETGLKGSNFAFRLQEALESHGYSVFCYAAVVKAGQRWVSPFNDGVSVCEAFIPICSPEYGDMDLAPWTTAELLQAARERAPDRRNGLPHIIPIRHHGKYPPASSSALASILYEYDQVPDPDERDHRKMLEARQMKLDDVWQLVVARLEDAGVVPAKKKRELAAAPTLCARCGLAPMEEGAEE